MENVTLSDAAIATGGVLVGEGGRFVRGVSVDSRQIREGELFFAIPGKRTDGHRYVRMCAERGAAGAVVSAPVDSPEGFPLIYVADTAWALGCLARWYRRRYNIPVVGITGSAGKTTTKEMTAAALSVRHRVLKSSGNLNTEIGLPLTLVQLEAQHTVAVLEMAMRGRGQIDWLAYIARPTIGVVTNIGWAHLEMLGSRDNIAVAKTELLYRLPEDGVAILNADDEYYEFCRLQAPCRVVSYGSNRPAEVRARQVEVDDKGRVRCTVQYEGQAASLTVPLPGLHQLSNALAALAVAVVLQVPLEEAVLGIEQMSALPQRMRVLAGARRVTVLDDTYNANPASVMAAVHTLRQMANGNSCVVVLGDMLELGSESARMHREVGQEVARTGVRLLVAVGEMAGEVVRGAQEVKGSLPCVAFANSMEAAQAIWRYLEAGDTVLVKGSRALQMERVVQAICEDRAECSGSG